MRTVDVARRAGYSVQQIRNLERDGVLPMAIRTATGYRRYGELHLRSAVAYRALTAGVGPVEAKRIVRAVHERPFAQVLALLDAAHARLHRERADLELAQAAAAAISAEPIADVRPSDAMSVSELAAALGVRPSTLRHWDAEGLVVPDRVSAQGTRRYSPAQVRDARIVHQLRSAGYRVDLLRRLLPGLPRGEVAATLAARDANITARSRALLDAAAALGAVLALVAHPAAANPDRVGDAPRVPKENSGTALILEDDPTRH
ncbi:MerR family transcriptional regulator [Nocardia abscessus]|uniref:MerR family transcriptional regulator n=1 Tax=Nocardia abscessus TaxID=120957 RepID=UPI002455A94B|nr:MerR family transcriptional regulator [Nocardia abscessus]